MAMSTKMEVNFQNRYIVAVFFFFFCYKGIKQVFVSIVHWTKLKVVDQPVWQGQ